MMQPSDVIAHHRRAVAGFSAVVAQAGGRWTNPSPCSEWDARGVLDHVIGIHDDMLLRPTGAETSRPGDGPVARWSATVAAIDSATKVAASNDVDGQAATPAVNLDEVLPALTGEVLAHTWDLAKAVGVDPQLDTKLCEISYGFMRAHEKQVRSSGLFGSAVPLSSDADAATQFIAFVGRDPGWTA